MRPLATLLLLLPWAATAATLEPGHLLVSDLDTGTLVQLDPERCVPGDCPQEVLVEGTTFIGIAVDLERTVLGANGFSLARLDPADPDLIPVLFAGVPFVFPLDVVVDDRGRIFVLDDTDVGLPGEPSPPGLVFRMDASPSETDGTLLYSTATHASGGDLVDVQQFAIHPDGSFYVESLNLLRSGATCDPTCDPNDFVGGIVRVATVRFCSHDPAQECLLDEDCGDGNTCEPAAQERVTGDDTQFPSPSGVAVDPSGKLVVATAPPEDPTPLKVGSIDPTNGAETLISEDQELLDPVQLAVDPAGDIWVADAGGATEERPGSVIRVAPDGTQQRVEIVWLDDEGTRLPFRPGGLAIVPPEVDLAEGDILVSDRASNALVRVDPQTGEQALLRVTPEGFRGLARASATTVFATRARQVTRIDPTRSTEVLARFQVCSDGGDPRNCLVDPVDVENEQAASVFVLDADFDADEASSTGAVYRVALATGVATPVSSEESLLDVRQLARQGGGILYAAAFESATPDQGAIVRVDPADGAQSVVATLAPPSGIAVDANGDLVVVSPTDLTVRRVDPESGAPSPISTGMLLRAPEQLALEEDGGILVADGGDAGSGIPARVIRVDPGTGAQEVVTSGGHLVDPVGILVVPEPSGGWHLGVALATLAALISRRGSHPTRVPPR